MLVCINILCTSSTKIVISIVSYIDLHQYSLYQQYKYSQSFLLFHILVCINILCISSTRIVYHFCCFIYGLHQYSLYQQYKNCQSFLLFHILVCINILCISSMRIVSDFNCFMYKSASIHYVSAVQEQSVISVVSYIGLHQYSLYQQYENSQ